MLPSTVQDLNPARGMVILFNLPISTLFTLKFGVFLDFLQKKKKKQRFSIFLLKLSKFSHDSSLKTK